MERGEHARLGIVYGRRRQGKSFLLQSLVEATGGFYWQALQQSTRQNLDAFARAWTNWVGGVSGLYFRTWDEAFHAVVGAIPVESPRPVVLDEVGFVFDAAPEAASMLQAALTPLAVRRSGVRLVLCGSAFGQMRRLIDAGAPLRGRASLDLVLRPFDYRTAAGFWGLGDNPDAGFMLHALVGGTPAYRELVGERPRRGDVRAWAIRHLLDRRGALAREGRVVTGEDPALGDQQLYRSVLGAIATGAHRRADIAARLDRPETSLTHALNVLMDAGWIDQLADPLHDRRSTYRLAEPIVRTWHGLLEPNLGRLEGPRPDPTAVWRDNESLVASRILAPHLEDLAREWCWFWADPALIGGQPSVVGSSEVRVAGERHQLDLVAVRRDEQGRHILAIGEVKAGSRPVGVGELDRLDRVAAGAALGARRILVGRAGFTAALQRVAATRPEVVLVDLATLYR